MNKYDKIALVFGVLAIGVAVTGILFDGDKVWYLLWFVLFATQTTFVLIAEHKRRRARR